MNVLAIISIEIELTKILCLGKVIDEFAATDQNSIVIIVVLAYCKSMFRSPQTINNFATRAGAGF